MRSGLATLLSTWVLLLSLATVSPELQSWFHLQEESTCAGFCHSAHSDNDADESDKADHICAVTLFACGVDYVMPFSLPGATFLPTGVVHDPDVKTPFVARRFFIHARAPPVTI